MKVYIVTYQTEQCDSRIGALYLTLEEAKAEVVRLEAATPWGSAMVIIRDLAPCPNCEAVGW